MTMRMKQYEMKRDVAELLRALKKDIDDDYRVSDDPEDKTPGMLVTIGADDELNWAYQTGDNSYSGAAYHYPHWGLVYLYRRTNTKEAARDAVNEILESIAQKEAA